jgi:hypothetical protein
MENELRKITQGNDYHILHEFFDDSRCNAISLIGPTCALCKESGAETFNEWYKYYLFNTPYHSKIGVAAKLLREYNETTKKYSFDVCYKVVLALALYQTWVGCQLEIKARNLLRGCKWYIKYAGKDEDNKYAVDLIVTRNNKVILGIQVKPISYYYSHEKPNSPLHQVNIKKNIEFNKKYGCNVEYLYYNNYEFNEEDIERIKNLIREEVDRCDTI